MSDPGAIEHWAQVDLLLDRVLSLPPVERAAFVERQTTDDPRLREEVLALLEELATRGDLLDRPALEALSRRTPRADLRAGHRFGAYEIVSLLGRGGMGEVYRAARADGQFEHQVALKLLRQDAVEHLGLFVSERRILARLEHPGIARLYDAGVGEDGRPYMLMELVEGVPITDWCRQRNADLHERLALFAQVCEAVAYAHQNLVIHRDLKPGNILVTADGRAKLLDFGIAKLLSDAAEEATRGTPLTLSYAAPEQLMRVTVSTATDIYALGVLLFELLTDRLPWAVGQIPIAVAIDKVLHETAPALSVAAARMPSPPVSPRLLAGDLDAIVGKALRKEPGDRYATVVGLRADVHRHTQGEPVLARENSRLYVLGRFLRRYRWATAAVVTLVLALAAGLAGTLWQAQRAEQQARTASATTEFLGDLFRANASSQEDPVKARDTTARQLLDMGAKKIGTAMADAPAAKIDVLSLMSQLYSDLALDDEAVRLQREAVALTRSIHGEQSTETAAALVNLAGAMYASDTPNEREAVLNEAQAILDRRGDQTSTTRALLLTKQAEYYQSSDVPRAIEFGRRAVEVFDASPPSKDLAEALYVRGLMEQNTGLTQEAVASFSRAVAVSRSVDGFPNASLPRFYAYLGEAQSARQDMAGAEQSARLALQTAIAINGVDHVDTLQTEMRLGRILFDTGRTREGLALMLSAKQRALRIRGLDDPFHTPQTLIEYGLSHARMGAIESGLADMEAAIANRRKNRPGTLYLAVMLDDAGSALVELGRWQDAAAYLDEATDLRVKGGLVRGTKPFNLNTSTRVRLALARGQVEQASTLLEQFAVERVPGQAFSATVADHDLMAADIDLVRGNNPEAVAKAEAVRDSIHRSGLGRYLRFYALRADLVEGKALMQDGKPGAALPLLQRALDTTQSVVAPESPRLAEAQVALGECLLALGRSVEARRLAYSARKVEVGHQQLGDQYRAPLRRLELALADAGD